MSFKIETHLHTAEGSDCASLSGTGQAECRFEEGYDAIIVTDHFYRGNTHPDRHQPWEDYVDEFASGYEHAKKRGDELGLKVFFGWEEAFGNGEEFLCYGPDKDWLKAHPEMIHWTPEEYADRLHAVGGFIVQAHPFRMRGYIKGLHLYPEYADAVEVVNSCNKPIDNVRAKAYAKSFDLPTTGGSDIHHKETIGGGMVFEKPINSIEDYRDYVLNRGKYIILE